MGEREWGTGNGESLKRGTGADSPFLVLKIAENYTKPVADPGEGPGGNGLPLIFGPNRGPRGQKKLFGRRPPPPYPPPRSGPGTVS